MLVNIVLGGMIFLPSFGLVCSGSTSLRMFVDNQDFMRSSSV